MLKRDRGYQIGGRGPVPRWRVAVFLFLVLSLAYHINGDILPG